MENIGLYIFMIGQRILQYVNSAISYCASHQASLQVNKEKAISCTYGKQVSKLS